MVTLLSLNLSASHGDPTVFAACCIWTNSSSSLRIALMILPWESPLPSQTLLNDAPCKTNIIKYYRLKRTREWKTSPISMLLLYCTARNRRTVNVKLKSRSLMRKLLMTVRISNFDYLFQLQDLQITQILSYPCRKSTWIYGWGPLYKCKTLDTVLEW